MRSAIFFFAVCVFFTGVFSGDALGQNYKIKQKMTMSGQTFESTTYVKGQRKRSERSGIMGMGGDVADIEQCDLKQYVKVNDKKKLVFIEPFDDDLSTATPATRPSAPKTSQPVTKGGTVTMTTSVIDTGERKQVNGFTARRVKSSISSEPSPDACNKQSMKIETDGWYIDLPEFVCPVNIRREMPEFDAPSSDGGCRDKIVVKSNGNARKGFALSETMTFTSGGQSFTQTTETIEVSRMPLDQALFDVPAGYRTVSNSNDLYGQPNIAEMMKAAEEAEKNNNTLKPPAAVQPEVTGPKRPGTIRIGVLLPVNRSDETLSLSALQAYLISRLAQSGYDAVPLDSAAAAGSRECDYVLTTDLSKLKQSTGSKIGGFLGKVTNTDTSGSKNYEAQVDYFMTKVADGKVVVKNKASKKVDGSAERAAESVLEMVAYSVIPAIK